MKTKMNQKGVTLIELMVALVICAIVIAAIYRFYIAQTRAYTVQDQVAETQQGIRSAMEILIRDIRMAGSDDDSNAVTVNNPFVPGNNTITMNYEQFNPGTGAVDLRTVTYTLVNGNLRRREWSNGVQQDADPDPNGEVILENVSRLFPVAPAFPFGIDTDNDGYVNNWVDLAGVGTSIVVAVRIQLVATPNVPNPDFKGTVNPRVLDSVVTMRNQISRSLSQS
jgi:type IV pilus assembly protein PilW